MKKITFNISTCIILCIFSVHTLFAQLPEGSHLLVSDITAQISSTSAYKILKFDHNGENGEIFTDQQLAWPQDIVIAQIPNEGFRVLVSNLSSGRITKYDLDGNYVGNFATGIGGPTRMRIKNNILYVLQWFNQSVPEYVLRFALDGTPLSNFTNTGIRLSIGMDWDASDNFYVSSYGQPPFNGNPAIPAQVYKYNSMGLYEGVFISELSLSGPTNIWFDTSGNGDLLVIDYNDNSIKRFNSNGVLISTIVSGLSTPEGVAFLSNGYFLVGNGLTGLIKMYDNDGNFIENFIDSTASSQANLINPNAFYIMPSTLSISEVNLREETFITPTVGHQFKFNPEITKPSDKIYIYNTIGKLIETITLDNNLEWTPSTYSSGVYFVHMTSNNKKEVQKIVIKN
ncbi:T9SS type A sorting domain-containing protein [Psychroserpens luteolus]|uniref:T9SS type A sorting domain-containing protein n=1 Tax=Psychroserpens luteolus TaxID=2855840 RepID=UPI001E3C7641|nr:T9SS type A sorting domain-containing protein [Psychroserpens luteolus]MCD2261003.1 T9SS type A sorting domain-containing protein [Psychroserpens luteolus]